MAAFTNSVLKASFSTVCSLGPLGHRDGPLINQLADQKEVGFGDKNGWNVVDLIDFCSILDPVLTVDCRRKDKDN